MKEFIEKTLKNKKIDTNTQKNSKFSLFFDILIEKNKKMNLTRITKKEDVAIKHFLDSVTAESFIPKNSKVIDIGAGAGFPSIPLKIIRDDLSFTLVDSVKKKVDFLNDTIEKLDLSKIKAIHARSEDLAHDIEFREKFDVCIARAVAELNILCEYCLPFVKQGGLFIAYKSISCEEEIERAKKAMEKIGWRTSRNLLL